MPSSDKALEALNNFMQASLATEFLVVLGLLILMMIVFGVMLWRFSATWGKERQAISKSNEQIISSMVETDKEHKTQRDDALAALKVETTKREEERSKHDALIERITATLEADHQMRVHSLEYDRQRTQAYVNTSKAMDEMRSDNARALNEERTNIQAIMTKIDAQAAQLTALVTASSSLPQALAGVIQAELADVHTISGKLSEDINRLELLKSEIVGWLDKGKDDVMSGVNKLDQKLTGIVNQLAEPVTLNLPIPPTPQT